MAHLIELLELVLMAVAAVAVHHLPATSFWRTPKGMSLLGGLFLSGFIGWKLYQNYEEEKKIELSKWDFAVHEENKTGSMDGYCTYLAEYPTGEYAGQAKIKCYPTAQAAAEPAPATDAAAPAIDATAAPAPEPASEPIADAAAPAPAVETRQDFEPEMVQLPNGKWMGKYEVTQAQWQAVMGDNPSHFKECGGNCPVENVTWDDVQIYIQKLNEKTGKSYRLPTEEEWFAACQAGKTTGYCGSNNADEVAWYDGNSGNTTHPVGQKTDNGWGLHDMSGNVWEWTSSLYDNEHDWRVLRGGSWANGPLYLRSANRLNYAPDNRNLNLGFRLSRM